MSEFRPLLLQNPVFVALAAWLVPGSGYWLIGQKWRAGVIGVSIPVCFWIGMLIGGATSVIDRQQQWMWYLAQCMAGVNLLLGELVRAAGSGDVVGGKSVDLGLVFTGVAGLLNLVAVVDTLGRAFPPDGEQPAAPGGR